MAEYSLSEVMKRYQYSAHNRIVQYRKFLEKFGDCIESAKASGQGGVLSEIHFKPEKFHLIDEYCKRTRGTPKSHGYVYAFELLLQPGCFKIGKTSNWEQRRKSYSGFNTPGKVLFLHAVKNKADAERKVLEFVNTFMEPISVGREWKRTDMSYDDVFEKFAAFLPTLN